MDDKLSVLVIPGHTLFPADSGGAHNQLSLLIALQYIYRLTVIITPDNVDHDDMSQLQSLLEKTTLVPVGFETLGKPESIKRWIRKKKMNVFGKDSAQQLSRTPVINGFILNDSGWEWQILNFATQNDFDLIQVDHTRNLSLACLLSQKRKVVYVHHELYFIRVCHELGLKSYKQAYVDHIANLVKEIELHYLRQCHGIVTFSEDDQYVLQHAGLMVPMQVSKPYCIFDTSRLVHDPHTSAKLIFIGGESHYPNKEGLAWFLEAVYPLLSPEVQKTEIWITGQWSLSFKEKYQHLPLHFTGFVPNLDPLLTNAILIAPIRIGSGVRIKICTSMAKGIPIVSTTVGAAGIGGLVHEENILLADTAHAFSEATEKLVRQKELRQKLSENIVALAQTLFDGDEFVRTRANFLQQIASSSPAA